MVEVVNRFLKIILHPCHKFRGFGSDLNSLPNSLVNSSNFNLLIGRETGVLSFNFGL